MCRMAFESDDEPAHRIDRQGEVVDRDGTSRRAVGSAAAVNDFAFPVNRWTGARHTLSKHTRPEFEDQGAGPGSGRLSTDGPGAAQVRRPAPIDRRQGRSAMKRFSISIPRTASAGALAG